ncbi:MAG: Crp/Fnr family transcriptional regulator [Verrucomicrobia bacterium]|nr:Crp/Fnr family transcriptional regulator [Cytophagales bacterium]
MSGVEIIDYLLQMPKYSVQDNVCQKQIKKGEYLYHPGETQNWIYMINNGAMKIGSYSAEGEEVVYDIVVLGETLGDLDYLNDVVFFEYSKALCATHVTGFRTPFFKNIIIQEPIIAEWFQQAIVRRWWKAENRLFLMTRGNIDARLSSLQKQFEKVIVDANGKVCSLSDVLSTQDWADLTGVTRQTIAKKMKTHLV